MNKLRESVAVLFVLSSLVCAVWALPPLTSAQQKAKGKCDNSYNDCVKFCNQSTDIAPGGNRDTCNNDCMKELMRCYEKIGIKASPGTRLTNGARVPQGTLTQASPTATPKTGVRQPQATLRKTTPTPTPTPHSSPTAIFKKKKSDH